MPKRNPQTKSPGQPPPPVQSKNPFALNPDYNRQTRKILGKHYRTKYGVR